MALLIYFVATFARITAKKKPNEAGTLKGVSGSPSQHAHPKYHLNHF